MILVITYFHFLITWHLSKVLREFISLSLLGSHCSSAAEFPLKTQCFSSVWAVLLFLGAYVGWSSS